MRTFLYLCSALSLLISAHMFSLADVSGQYKSALFFLFIGIQMLITGTLIGGHQDERDLKSQTDGEVEEKKAAGFNHVKESVEEGKRS